MTYRCAADRWIVFDFYNKREEDAAASAGLLLPWTLDVACVLRVASRGRCAAAVFKFYNNLSI